MTATAAAAVAQRVKAKEIAPGLQAHCRMPIGVMVLLSVGGCCVQNFLSVTGSA
jgi:hypothetical protein